VTEGAVGRGLSERLFEARLDLVLALDEQAAAAKLGLNEPGVPFEHENVEEQAPGDEDALRTSTLQAVRNYVAGMSLDNFVVRPHRRVVEKYQGDAPWAVIDAKTKEELVEEVAALPSEVQLGNEPAKRFDLLMLNLQLALLRKSKSFDRYRQHLLQIASALEEQFAIPLVAAQRELILDIQTEPWWIGVNVRLLELVRLRLRNLVQHVEKTKQPLIYSDFQDELGPGLGVDLPDVGAVDFKRFKRKARHFLLGHQDNLALQKLRRGKPLTPTDLQQLEALMLSAGVGDRAQLDQAAEASHGLGRFIRSLVGLDRGAVAEAFSTFLNSGTATADQMVFVELVIEHLTHEGVMDPKRLYESPFTDIAPSGPEQVFPLKRTDELFEVIDRFNTSAAAS
jgi:type I restriction enzyme R subunit